MTISLGLLGTDIDTPCIIGLGLALHQAGNFAELPPDFDNDARPPTAFMVSAEKTNGRQTPTKMPRPSHSSGKGCICPRLRPFFDEVGDQGKRGQRGRADGKALSGGGRRISERIKGVGALADLLRQAGHLGDAAGVVGHGAVGVRRQRDAEGGEHTDGGQRNAVKAELGVAVISDRRAEKGGANRAEMTTGRMVENMPKPTPLMIMVAVPVSEEAASLFVGLYVSDVKNSVKNPIRTPAKRPAIMASQMP